MKKKAKLLKESYINQITDQRRGKKCIETPVRVVIDLYFGDRRKRDRDNYNKLIMDSLEGIILTDDVQIMKGSVEKFYDKENPRAEITIYPYER